MNTIYTYATMKDLAEGNYDNKFTNVDRCGESAVRGWLVVVGNTTFAFPKEIILMVVEDESE